MEALCLIPGQWVWRFQLALTVLDDGGNIMDAAVMAAIASLRHYRKPQVDLGGADGNSNNTNTAPQEDAVATAPILIPSHLKEPTPLPLHHTPLSISFAFIAMEDGSSLSTTANMSSSSGIVAALVDPTDREELLQSGSLTVGMNVHAEVCLIDYGGGCELPPPQLEKCWKKAESCVRQLCTMLETSLEDADQQAQKDRLEKLKQQQQQGSGVIGTGPSPLGGLPPLPNETSPYFEQSDNPSGNVTMMGAEETDAANDAIKRMETEAEEAYRQQALDYSQGYKANKVKEDDDHMRHSSQPYFNQASKLMKSLLASASQPDAKSKNDNQHGNTTTNPSTDKASTTRKVKTAKQKATNSSGPMDDSEEEEETTQLLQSEFANPAVATGKPMAEAKTEAAKPKEEMMDNDNDSDIDDLAQAIVTKKKKKKKSKK